MCCVGGLPQLVPVKSQEVLKLCCSLYPCAVIFAVIHFVLYVCFVDCELEI